MTSVPVVDVSDIEAAAPAIDRACREVGFVSIVGHGIDPALTAGLDALAREFFARPDHEKAAIEMARGGRAWRGWFPVGGELTSGTPDVKEGIYFGAELAPDDPRVVAGTPMHGANLFPAHPAGLRDVVLAYLGEAERVGQAVLRAMAIGLGWEPGWFVEHLTADPLVLFRIFHYPPVPEDDDRWGVGEHTDYGLLTLLAQDASGGLQVGGPGGWVDVAPIDGALVCNLGDMLERVTGGAYRSTPHRVRNVSGADRLSMPFFLDPSWDARIPGLAGTYGDYITSKVTKVFPNLA